MVWTRYGQSVTSFKSPMLNNYTIKYQLETGRDGPIYMDVMNDNYQKPKD